MSYYSISTPDMKRSGTANVSAYEPVDSPYNFLDSDTVHFFNPMFPFHCSSRATLWKMRILFDSLCCHRIFP